MRINPSAISLLVTSENLTSARQRVNQKWVHAGLSFDAHLLIIRSSMWLIPIFIVIKNIGKGKEVAETKRNVVSVRREIETSGTSEITTIKIAGE
ncbi:MAG: hypothetical protein CVU57_02795 [Deltaproteobacteria bacterium HGW-Deltaproteobacteria-15]|nr:MAG: hypothetical protein CVU57_02795 [Deltaproteobacteria bacterium HGW-Deltaproteobacteria-15]